jgi:hypothetical protein
LKDQLTRPVPADTFGLYQSVDVGAFHQWQHHAGRAGDNALATQAQHDQLQHLTQDQVSE